MKIKDFALMAFIALTAFQAGFLTKSYFEYRYGPVPMITPSEFVALMEER